MFRTPRALRRPFALAIAAGALFAFPAAAQANATLSFTGQPAGTAVAGDTVNYTLNIDVTTDFGADATVEINTPDGGTLGALAVVPGLDLNDARVTVMGNEITLLDTLDSDDGDVEVTIPVTMPRAYTPNFNIATDKTSGAAAIADIVSANATVSKGGPSDLRTRVTSITSAAALTNKWVKKGVDASATLTVTNAGTGAAHFVDIDVDLDYGNNELLSPETPNPPNTAFAPEFAIGAGTCAVTSPSTCTIAEIAPGATVTIPVTITKITHYGYLSVDADIDSKADNGTNRNCGNSYDYNTVTGDCDIVIDALDGFNGYVSITDGTTIEPHVGVLSGATSAAGGAAVSFTGGVSAAGSAIAAGSLLEIRSTPYKDNVGVGTSYEGDAGVSQSIQSVTVPGATCANYVDPATSKKQLDRFICVLPAISANTRAAFSVGAKFATNQKNVWASVSATLHAPGYAQVGSENNDSDSVRLNVDKTTDISVVAKSAALVGAGNVAPVDVTIKNTGTTKARWISFTASTPNGAGSFGDVDQNAACAVTRGGMNDAAILRCTSGELAAGASRTMTIWVTAGTKLGALPVSISASYSGDGYDLNPDNDWVIQNMTIVKKSSAPLLGVKVAKAKALKKAALVKAGFKTVVTTPGAAVVKVDIVVTGKVAKQLGLIKKASKKDVVIGTKKVKTTKSQKVTVTTKLSLKYKAKIAKVKKKFTAKRVVTVTSTDRKTSGATSLTSANMPVK